MPQAPPAGPLCTRVTIADDLRKAGLQRGDAVLLHSSLRRIGWINGGSQALVQSFLDVLGEEGTLVVPTHTGDNSDPAKWECPPVPEDWWQTIRDTMPAFDSQTSRTRAMGVVPETVRTWHGAVRSQHPQTSFTAVGAKAKYITSDHGLDSMLGEKSPLARLEELNAKVMLLGVGFDTCTCIHLAEYRVNSPRGENSFAVVVDGKREWMTVSDLEVNSDDFEELGKDFKDSKDVVRGKIGAADCLLFSLADMVQFAQDWFLAHRKPHK